ncbi:MAG: HAMP domain-containing sensor histidine kinase [Patescibacteria group bacterium]
MWKEVRAREEIERLAKELEKANVRLKELDQAKSEFVTITSHQLRAPITAIKGYSSMLMEGTFGPVPEKARTAVDRILQSSDRLVRLIADFLNLSRIERGKMEYDFQKFDLKDLVKSIFDDFFQINGKRKIPLKFSLELDENEKFMVTADQEKVRQAMSNLIDNALKYTKEGFAKISLYKNPEKNTIIFKVQDSGMGMDKDSLARIFQKFTRAHNGTLSVHVEGTGLGLYVAKEIMSAHGGDIWAESRGIGKGSSFSIEFPMKFITPQEKQKMEEEQKQREQNVERFVKGI